MAFLQARVSIFDYKERWCYGSLSTGRLAQESHGKFAWQCHGQEPQRRSMVTTPRDAEPYRYGILLVFRRSQTKQKGGWLEARRIHKGVHGLQKHGIFKVVHGSV